MVIGNAASERQENVVVNEGTNDRDFTVGISSKNSVVTENAMNVKFLERCFKEKIAKKMSNNVDTVENGIQNAILTAIDTIVAPKIELAIRSKMHLLDVMRLVCLQTQNVCIKTLFENASGKKTHQVYQM